MAETSFRKFYGFNEFAALVTLGFQPNADAFATFLGAASFGTQPDTVQLIGGDTIMVEWASYPSAADVSLLDGYVALFDGIAATSQSFQVNSFDPATSNSSTPVVKATLESLPLNPGRWRVSWVSSIRMSTTGASSGVQASINITRSDNVSVSQTDAWDLNVNHAYNGSYGFEVLAGQTIEATLSFNRIGAAGVAEMSGVSVMLDKVS